MFPLRPFVLLLLSMLCLRNSLSGQLLTRETLPAFYQQVVEALAHDSLQGRPMGSIYEQKAAAYIASHFKQAPGFIPRFHSFKLTAPDSATSSKSTNVFCWINNRADSTVLIGAHYDHLGLGGKRSLSLGKRGVHNGADDNASGVALLLGLARTYASWGSARYNYVFVAYSAHEVGLFGSSAFAKKAMKSYGPLALVLNFDMVGRMHPQENRLKVIGVGTTPLPFSSIEVLNPGLRFRAEQDSLLKQLDTRAFYAAGVPCLSFSTGVHDDYHKLSDDAGKINYQGILSLQVAVEGLLRCYPGCPGEGVK